MLTSLEKQQIQKLRTIDKYGYKTIASTLNLDRDQVRHFCRTSGLAGSVGINKPLTERQKKVKIRKVTATNCSYCSLELNHQNARGATSRYCSRKCRDHYNAENGQKHCVLCKFCLAPFETKRRDQAYCSPKCGFTDKWTLKGTARSCSICSKSFQPTRKMQKCCSLQCSRKSSQIHFRKLSDEKRKSGASRNFRGTAVLSGYRYREWRSKVFERDRYICRKCGWDKGKNLNAHHIESWADNQTLRYEIDNGVTLCKKCHTIFHVNFGYGQNTKEQFDNFMKGGDELWLQVPEEGRENQLS